MGLNCIFLSERSQSKKAPHDLIPLVGHFGKGTATEMLSRSVLARGSETERPGRVEPGETCIVVELLFNTRLMDT